VTTVHNLNDPDHTQVFSCSPRAAVIAAHAQSLGDWNTADYESRYGVLAQAGQVGWNCGNFWAKKEAE
jgi:hypothetical protein